MKVSEIKTAKPFDCLFPIDPQISSAIYEHMDAFGFDESQPLVVWKGKNLLIDGHTRLNVARMLKLKDIPTIEKDFKDEDEALEYALHNQRDRRNMTDADIIRIIQLVDKRKEKYSERNGNGKFTDNPKSGFPSSKETAQTIGIGKTKVEETRTVIDYADENTKQAILNGEKSIHSAYEETQEKRKEEKQSSTKPLFNQTNENIEWAKWSWNPVVGCEHGCEYCYARDIANRFYGNFKPRFLPERLAAPSNMPKPLIDAPIGERNVFTVSMGDLFGDWVKQDWIDKVLNTIGKSPEWNFLLLTKNPKRLTTIKFPQNVWIGTTVDCQARVHNAEEAFKKVKASVKFVSVEPMREAIKFKHLSVFDWLIIGGQSKSSQCPEMQPKWEWVENLLNDCRTSNVKVYFKPNLKCRPKEYPE